MRDIDLNKAGEQIQDAKESDTNKSVEQETIAPVKDERDVLDGGFAVVDRERLIEEETREVKPWYKFFIEAFTSPSMMIEECYGQEPYRGASYGVVGCMLFAVISCLIKFCNPVVKAATIEVLRKAGTAETKLSQAYSVGRVSGVIGAICQVFLVALASAIVIQIIKAIAKDKASFSNIYKMLLIVQMVTLSISMIDTAASCLIGISGPVFQLGVLFGEAAKLPVALQALFAVFSLSNMIGIIWLVIGYRAVTHVKTKKAVIVVCIYEILFFVYSYGRISAAQTALKMAANMNP